MDVRRSARVTTEFFVAIQGLESEPVLREGNISMSGIYFVTEVDVGEVGMLSWLSVTTVDRTRTLQVMAHVVRQVRVADVDGKVAAGAAFEFVPESEAAAATVKDFVRYVLSMRREGVEPQVAPRLGAHVNADGDLKEASIRQLSVRSMVLETNWMVTPGDIVFVDVHAPGMANRIRLQGRTIRITPTGGEEPPTRYTIELEIAQETERPLGSMAPPPPGSGSPASVPLALHGMGDEEVSRTVDELLSALIMPPTTSAARPRRTHLSGLISRIPLPTLCALFDMERMTGKLVVRRGEETTSIYVREGQLLDVEPLASYATPRARLDSLLALKEGSFEFNVQPIDRENRVGIGTTALLLELARATDEAKRAVPTGGESV
jgi:hypothetical protein